MKIRVAPNDQKALKKRQWTRFGFIVGCTMVAGYGLYPLVSSESNPLPDWVFMLSICGLFPYPVAGIVIGLVVDGIGAEIRRERILNAKCWSCGYTLESLEPVGDILNCPECNHASQIVPEPGEPLA